MPYIFASVFHLIGTYKTISNYDNPLEWHLVQMMIDQPHTSLLLNMFPDKRTLGRLAFVTVDKHTDYKNVYFSYDTLYTECARSKYSIYYVTE